MNNAEIDYAKTLWRPTIPKDKKDIMKKYVGVDVPYFFMWAKDKKKDIDKEMVEDTTMYKIYKGIKDVRLTFSCFNNLDKINHEFLMNDTSVELDERIIELYDRLCMSYNSKFSNLVNKDNDNLKTYIRLVKDKFSELEEDESKIADILTIYLYRDKIDKIKGKQIYWYVYGDYIVDNLRNNIDSDTKVCIKCGRRERIGQIINGKCSECREEIKLTGMKKVICVDCGDEFKVESTQRRTKRCKDCQDKINKEKRKEIMRNARKSICDN